MKEKVQVKISKYRKIFTQQLLEFQLQMRIILENEIVKIQPTIFSIVIILSHLQEISFLFDNYYQSSQPNFNFHFIPSLVKISKFVRPYKILEEDFYTYSYIFPLIIHILYYLFVLKLFIEFKIHKKKSPQLINIFYSQNRISVIFMVILTYIQAMLFHLFFVIFAEMTVSSIQYNSRMNQIQIENIIFAIITLIIVILNMITQMICNLEPINLTQLNFGVLFQSFSLYWQQMSKLWIILINQLDASHNLKFYLILFFLMFRIVFQVQQQIFNFLFPFNRAIIEFFGMAGQLLIMLILLFFHMIQSNLENYDALLFFLILYPPIIYIISDQFSKYHNSIIIDRKFNQYPNKLQYKILELFLKFGTVSNSFVNQKQHIVFINNFKITHRINCQQSKCECNYAKQSFESIINLYIKEQILIFGESINLVKDESTRQSFFLRYLLFLKLLGYNTKAFQQSNIQIIQETQKNSNLNLYKNQRSEVDRGESSNSLDQKSHSLQKFSDDLEYDEFTRIKLGQLNMIKQIKLKLIQEIIKSQMNNSLRKQNSLQENIEHAVNLFLISENGNKMLKEKIIKCLNRKRQLFNNLNLNSIQLFSDAKQLLVKLKRVESQLYKLYDQFPSRKMQALITFFQAEIMNNYFTAYKLSIIASISDEKLLKMQSQIKFDLFSNRIDYLILGFDKKSHHLRIQQTSNQIHQFFGYSQDQFKKQEFIEFIIPQGFGQIHQKLVQSFLQTGESKYFRSINLSFCKTINKCMKPIDFFFDANLANFDELKFTSFLQDRQISSAYLLCCLNNKIQSMTKNIVQKLGYPSIYGQQLIDHLLRQSLIKIFPQYNNICESFLTRGPVLNKNQFEQIQQDEKQNYFDKSENQIQMKVPNIQIFENQQKFNWNEIDHFNEFQVDVVFHIRNIQSDTYQYLIIEIREAKKMMNTQVSTPFQTDRPISTNNNLEYLAQLTDFDNNFDIIDDCEQYTINAPRALEPDSINQQTHFGQRLKINHHNSQSQYPNISIALASPKDSAVRLIDDKLEMNIQFEANATRRLQKNKQQYFSALEQKDDQDSSNQISSLHPNKQDQNKELELLGIHQQLENKIKLQIIDNEIGQNQFINCNKDGSETSSLAGIKKSKFSKRYELVEKIVDSSKFSQHFLTLKYILTLMFFTFLIFGFIEIYFSNSDLPQFLQELDLLQIKANIIGPIDNYIVGQNDVVNYQILQLQNKITEIYAYQISKYSVNEINYTFYELKVSFENQLQNPYIDPFFEDRYIEVQMAKYPNLISYNIRVREAIQLELEAALNFIQIDFLKDTKIDFTQGFFAFLFKNYQPLRLLFQTLNEEMLDYSTSRSTSVAENWFYLLIPIIIVGSLLMVVSIVFYRFYLQQYDQFLLLFSKIDNVWLQKDIDRYRGFSVLLNKDSDVLFKYQFDLETKETALQNEQQQKDKQGSNQAYYKDQQNAQIGLKQKMSLLPSIFSFLIIYGVCFLFCYISNSLGQSYYQKYPDTTNFFNLLSDLSVASSGVFSMREISYNIQGIDSNFYFFSDKNASYFIDGFLKQINVIEKFLEMFAIFDSTNYITSETFVANFYDLMRSDICTFLPQYKIAGAQQHCSSALDGVMRSGMIQTLNKVRNSLLNEYESSSHFLNETINIQSDLIVGLIAYDVLNDLRDQFQIQLADTTNALINQILIINLIFIMILIVCIICLHTVIQSYFYREFQIVKHFIILMPQTSLFLDSQLDRNVRWLIAKDELI